MFLSSYHHEIFRSYYQWQKWCPCKRSRSEVDGQGHRGQNPIKQLPDCNSCLNSHMMIKWWKIIISHKKSLILTQIWRFRTVTPVQIQQWLQNDAQSSKEEVPYCFSRSFVKFQGHTWQKTTNFDPNWAFPDCNSSLNSPMALKWCIKLDIV